MNFEILQKLARSNEHQILFNRIKEIGSLKFFYNDSDLSRLQIYYLYFLEMYSMLYNDLNSGEEFITEEIIEDSIRVEAYLLFRKENKNKKVNSQHIPSGGAGSIIFKRGKRK